jgi:uncharacterized coiled-coil DUF342 family protein
MNQTAETIRQHVALEQINQDIAGLRAQRAQINAQLKELYQLRRGRVQFSESGRPIKAWCASCGVFEIDPETETVCPRCTRCGNE